MATVSLPILPLSIDVDMIDETEWQKIRDEYNQETARNAEISNTKKKASIRVKKGGAGSGHHGHVGRPGKVGGSLPGNGNIITKLAEDDPYLAELRDYLRSNEKKYAYFGREARSDAYFHLAHRAWRGQGDLLRDYAMAKYIEDRTDRDTMLYVMGSQESWTMGPSSSHIEFAAMKALGGNGTGPKGLIDIQLTDEQIEGFRARTEFVQATFRELYGEELKVYRGVSGAYGGKLKRAVYGDKITISDEDKNISAAVYGLSSFSPELYLARMFASTKSGTMRATGLVLSRTIKASDVWTLPRTVGVVSPMTFTDDRGEIVTINKERAADFYIEEW